MGSPALSPVFSTSHSSTTTYSSNISNNNNNNNESKTKKKRKKYQKKRKRKTKRYSKEINELGPVMVTMTLLSFWCVLSTFTLGCTLWIRYPTLSSVIDSTINSICLYLSFFFAQQLYDKLCGCCLIWNKITVHVIN